MMMIAMSVARCAGRATLRSGHCTMSEPTSKTAVVMHKGGCHCRDVTFQFQAAPKLVALECNCTNCSMRGNVHCTVDKDKFEIITGADALTTYTFGTGKAKHMFCRRCGITPFYVPRSHPEGFAITIACIDPGTVEHVDVQKFDGKNWEAAYEAMMKDKPT